MRQIKKPEFISGFFYSSGNILTFGRLEQGLIFLEYPGGDIIDGRGDEESAENIDRIMQMPGQNDSAEKDGDGDEQDPQLFDIPEDESHQERQAGVAGKEKIAVI